MAIPFPPASPGEIEGRFTEERRLFYRTLESLHDLAERLDEQEMGGMTRHQFFVLFQFVKALKTTQAMGALFFNGFPEDAEVLLRVLVDQAIIVRWVHQKDSDERVQAYALFLAEKLHGRLELVRKVVPDADLSRVPVERIESDYAEYLKLEKKLKWRGLTSSAEKMAIASGMHTSYLFHFYGSDFVHSNPTIEASYVRSEDGATWFNTVATMPRAGLSLVIALQHLAFIADAFNDVFELNENATLRALMDDLNRPPRLSGTPADGEAL
jgi:Family of unknown function (DUF5677)